MTAVTCLMSYIILSYIIKSIVIPLLKIFFWKLDHFTKHNIFNLNNQKKIDFLPDEGKVKVVFHVRRVKFLCYVETVAPGFVAESAVDVSPETKQILYWQVPKARLFY